MSDHESTWGATPEKKADWHSKNKKPARKERPHGRAVPEPVVEDPDGMAPGGDLNKYNQGPSQ